MTSQPELCIRFVKALSCCHGCRCFEHQLNSSSEPQWSPKNQEPKGGAHTPEQLQVILSHRPLFRYVFMFNFIDTISLWQVILILLLW